MSNWNGYRASKAAGGGALNSYATPKAKQKWAVGSTVNVGFVRNLLVTAHRDGAYRLLQTNSGKVYEFVAHSGLVAL